MSSKKRKIYDLSLPWSRNMPTYAMSLSFYNPPMIGTYSEFGKSLLEKKMGRTVGAPFYDSVLCFFSHCGTHFDAPIHCDKDAWSIDQVPLDRLWGEGVVVAIPKGELEEIGPEDLEQATPTIEKGDIVVVNTGWHNNYCGPIDDWERAVYYATKNPGVTKEGAEWLIKKGVNMFMVDYIGVDHPKYTERGDDTWPVHIGLLSNNIPMVQILAGQIDDVTGKRCTIVAAPVKWVGGDAFPVRVLAMVEE
jgi:kynurenine formamidase